MFFEVNILLNLLISKEFNPISESKLKPYTSVCFIPDYERLGISNLSQDMISLFQRRVYDIGGITPKDVKVKFNNISQIDV